MPLISAPIAYRRACFLIIVEILIYGIRDAFVIREREEQALFGRFLNPVGRIRVYFTILRDADPARCISRCLIKFDSL